MCDVKTKIMLRQFYLKVIHLKFTAFLHLSKLNSSIMYYVYAYNFTLYANVLQGKVLKCKQHMIIEQNMYFLFFRCNDDVHQIFINREAK